MSDGSLVRPNWGRTGSPSYLSRKTFTAELRIRVGLHDAEHVSLGVFTVCQVPDARYGHLGHYQRAAGGRGLLGVLIDRGHADNVGGRIGRVEAAHEPAVDSLF